MQRKRNAINPYDPPDATSPTITSDSKPRSLPKRLALTFLFSILLGLAMFFVFGFVGRTIALATLESDAYKQLVTRYGDETARGLYIMYWAHNCGDKALLAGFTMPWLYFFYSVFKRRTSN